MSGFREVAIPEKMRICEDFEGDKFSVKTFKKLFGDKIKPITGLELDYSFNKITCKTNEHSTFKEAYKTIEEDFDCIYHNAQFIELVPKGFSKVKGIEAIFRMRVWYAI